MSDEQIAEILWRVLGRLTTRDALFAANDFCRVAGDHRRYFLEAAAAVRASLTCVKPHRDG